MSEGSKANFLRGGQFNQGVETTSPIKGQSTMEGINDIVREKFGRVNIIQYITEKRRRFRSGRTEIGQVSIRRGRGKRSLGGDGGLVRMNKHEGEGGRANRAGRRSDCHPGPVTARSERNQGRVREQRK